MIEKFSSEKFTFLLEKKFLYYNNQKKKLCFFQFKMFFKCTYEVGADNPCCHIYHVLKSTRLRYAMADDNRAIDTQDGCSAIYLEIKVLEERIVKALSYLENFVNRLRQFQDHVTNKSLANNNIRFVE